MQRSSVFGRNSRNVQRQGQLQSVQLSTILKKSGFTNDQLIRKILQNAHFDPDLIEQNVISPAQTSPGDRFVPRRAGVDHQAVRSKLYSDHKDPRNTKDDIFVQPFHSWRLRGYLRLLGEHCGGGSEDPLLKLTLGDGSVNGSSKFLKPRGWPCTPRRKPVILQPDVIFDLPEYEESMDYDILDWGQRDLLVAGLRDQVFMLDSSTNHVSRLHSFDDIPDSVQVLKWDPFGVFIAIGTMRGRLFVYDANLNIMVPIMNKTSCSPVQQDHGSGITAIAWDPSGSQIACCISLGSLYICDTKVKSPPVRRKAHEGSILNCSYAPNGQFLVTCGVDCNVRIWNLPELKPFFQIVYANPVRAMAWHPWRSCHLAVGGGSGSGWGAGTGAGAGDGSLSIWDVALQSNLCHHLPALPCAVDSLAWSHLTGELVISYWLQGNRPDSDELVDGHSRILVLSAPGTATDEMYSPAGRTKALLFSPDGTKIATASSDENLFIWNFLGNGPLLNTYKRKIRKREKMFKIYEINEHNHFGFTIR